MVRSLSISIPPRRFSTEPSTADDRRECTADVTEALRSFRRSSLQDRLCARRFVPLTNAAAPARCHAVERSQNCRRRGGAVARRMPARRSSSWCSLRSSIRRASGRRTPLPHAAATTAMRRPASTTAERFAPGSPRFVPPAVTTPPIRGVHELRRRRHRRRCAQCLQLIFRPTVAARPYVTPNARCSSVRHPCRRGVHGMCGWHVAGGRYRPEVGAPVPSGESDADDGGHALATVTLKRRRLTVIDERNRRFGYCPCATGERSNTRRPISMENPMTTGSAVVRAC